MKGSPITIFEGEAKVKFGMKNLKIADFTVSIQYS